VYPVLPAICWGVSFQILNHVKFVFQLDARHQNFTMAAKLNGRWRSTAMIFLTLSFDVLKSDELEQVLLYINAHYRMARNEKTQKSGHHGNFASYCHGKKWLIYYDTLLKEDGNKDLNCFAFPTLPVGVVRTSSSFITPMKRKGIEPSPAGHTHGIATASGATIAAMGAMQSRVDGLKETEQRARLSSMKSEMLDWKSKAIECNCEYSKLGGKYLAAKSDGKNIK
jgi:hypothetical protein